MQQAGAGSDPFGPDPDARFRPPKAESDGPK